MEAAFSPSTVPGAPSSPPPPPSPLPTPPSRDESWEGRREWSLPRKRNTTSPGAIAESGSEGKSERFHEVQGTGGRSKTPPSRCKCESIPCSRYRPRAHSAKAGRKSAEWIFRDCSRCDIFPGGGVSFFGTVGKTASLPGIAFNFPNGFDNLSSPLNLVQLGVIYKRVPVKLPCGKTCEGESRITLW